MSISSSPGSDFQTTILSPRTNAAAAAGANSFARGQGLREITGVGNGGGGGGRREADQDYREALKEQVELKKKKQEEEAAKKRAIEAKEEERVR